MRLVFGGLLLAVAACSGADGIDWPGPGLVPPDSGTDAAGDLDAGQDVGSREDADPPPRDGGIDARVDAGPVTAFTNAPPFAGGLGPSARRGGHAFDPDRNPAGERCSNCHGGTAPTFVVSGTVYTSKNAETPAPGAEVVIRFPDGATHVVRTDSDGNFFMKQTFDIKSTPRGTLVGVRTASVSALKPTPLDTGEGECMNCHTSTAIHVP